MAIAATATAPGVLHDYVELLKPRIMVLLLVTTLGPMAWAVDGVPPAGAALVALLGMALASGGAAALNHVLDRDLDARMERTRLRPVAAGRVSPLAATVYGCALIAAGAVGLAVFANGLAAVLATAGALFYVLVYTALLKRRTPQNIVIGGAAGAMPPLVGWAVATGGLGLEPLVLFAIVFLWTPPHFWALALLARDDYARAGVPMLPVVATQAATARQILLYAVLLVPATLVPVAAGLLGPVYLVAVLLLDARLVQLSLRLRRTGTREAARGLFLFSLAYLALVMAAIAADLAAQAL